MLKQLPALQWAGAKIGRQGGPHQPPRLPSSGPAQRAPRGQGKKCLAAHRCPLLALAGGPQAPLRLVDVPAANHHGLQRIPFPLQVDGIACILQQAQLELAQGAVQVRSLSQSGQGGVIEGERSSCGSFRASRRISSSLR